MRLSRFLPSVVLLLSATATPGKANDISLVREELDRPGYFHGAAFSPHYDHRFGRAQLSHEDEREALKKLVQSYHKACHNLRVDTWLAHNTLLGWWWNKQVLPWDSAVTVQVFESDMGFLARNYNMSVSHLRRGPNFLLDVNPNYANQERASGLDAVDARWIDMESGLFINIMAARYDSMHSGEGMMSFRDGYKASDTHIIPLRKTRFEGVKVKIPYRYRELLSDEYGEQALSETENDMYRFDVDKMRWQLK